MVEQSQATRTAAEVVAAVRAKEFEMVRRGYDPDQVRTFLVEMSRAIELLEHRRQETRHELEAANAELARLRETAAPTPDPFEATGTRVAEILRSVSAEADTIRREATEAADRARSEAQAGADRMLQEAMLELTNGRDALLQELEGARERVSGILERLRATLRDRETAVDVPRQDPPAAVEVPADGYVPPATEAQAPDTEAAHGDEATPDGAEQGEPVIDDVIGERLEERPPAYLELFARRDRD